jgi:phospholipase/carboxylesterase
VSDLVYRLRPAATEPAGALLLLHGRGADEHDLFPLLDLLDRGRRLTGLTLRAPLSLPPGGAHWYRVREIGYPDPETFHRTFAALASWLDRLPELTGVPLARTVLGGFSQGAVMSYALGLGAGRPRSSPSPASCPPSKASCSTSTGRRCRSRSGTAASTLSSACSGGTTRATD